MKKLVNPTTYFFEQAELKQTQSNPEMDKFVNSLLNKDTC